ncbi:unnamed protein product [Durusdinium trenchii]|uniref:JmjC domain-containing protein n=1 Tax=Durusdinium trenchii TaxID=1381693 RepID=A0ABP0MCA6_9DINO
MTDGMVAGLPEDFLGREEELRWLLSYLTAGENQVNAVTRGRQEGSLGSFLFSLPSFVRSVQSFLAQKQLPPLIVEGSPGVGRSALLQAAARTAEQLPGLRVLLHRGSGERLLRRLYDGIDEVTDEELLLMPVISNAGRAGGVVLFLDDTEVAPWLLVPLPPGVRCVMAPRTDTPAPRGFACLRLEGLKGPAAEELQERLGCRVDGPVNPLELHLAAQLSRRNLDQCDLKELIAATVSTLEDAVGESVREALCAIACSRVGLHDEDGPREQEGFGQLRCVDGSFLQSYDDFERLRERSDEPLLIRQAAFTFEASRFSLDHLAEELKDLTLPQKSLSAKQGGNTSQCTLLVADQGGDAVMSAKPHLWNPQGCSFRTLAEKIRHGLYLTTRSGKARVRRVDEELFYDKVEDPDGKDVLVEAFVARVPVPLLLPKDLGCQVAFWMGTTGNNFGLHSDLFTEQFLCQHQGVKEVLLLLPEDAAIVQPFPFLESPLFYKSRARTVDNLTLSNAKCFRVVLEPGDVLFIPLFWWHEVRTLQGPAVSTTYRFHTEDAERFLKVMNAFYQFHKNALECAVFSEVRQWPVSCAHTFLLRSCFGGATKSQRCFSSLVLPLCRGCPRLPAGLWCGTSCAVRGPGLSDRRVPLA